MLKIPFLQTFLPDHDLRRLPTPDVQAVIGWGLKPSAAAGRKLAAARGLPYIALEDGFLRSVGLGEAGATSLSLSVDDLGIYYDATRPSRLERLIETAPDWCDSAMKARARALVDRIVETGLSKTNMGGPLDRSLLRPGRRVLIVDQTAGDQSIAGGLASPESFLDMVAAGRKQGCIPPEALGGLTLIDTDVRGADLLAEVDVVYAVTSALGFEAVLRLG
ncbi:MAG: capsular polysaccharide biosynthesis protein, partial [Brevundimonas sp.]